MAVVAHAGFEIFQGHQEVQDEGDAAAAPCYHRRCRHGHEDDDGTYLSSWEAVNLFGGDAMEADKGEESEFLPVRAHYHSLQLQQVLLLEEEACAVGAVALLLKEAAESVLREKVVEAEGRLAVVAP